MASPQVELTISHLTLAYNTVTLGQPLSTGGLCQIPDVQAGGRVGSDRQTLLSGIDKTQRQAAGPFFDDTLSSYILRHLSKLLRLFGDAADTRLLLKSKGEVEGNGCLLMYGLVSPESDKAFDLSSDWRGRQQNSAQDENSKGREI